MRECIKTAILFCLVATSIVLTGLLLFGQPPLETAAPPAYERLVFGEIRPVSEHIQPQLQLTTAEARQVLWPWHNGYGAAWEMILPLFVIRNVPEESQMPEEFAAPELVATFSVPGLPEIWDPQAASAELEITTMVWFAQDAQTVWYESAHGLWYSARLANLPDNWYDMLIDAFSVGDTYLPTEASDWGNVAVEGTVYIPASLPKLASYSVKPEELDTEKLLRSIFVDMALVRRIQERDGALIYTDGQRGLRIFAHGELEYTSPDSEPGLEPLGLIQALRRTAQYLQLMGGWPDNLYMKDVSAVDRQHWNNRLWDTYSFTFLTTQQGLPVLSINPPVMMRLSGRGVIDYRRQIVTFDIPTSEPAALLDPREAFQRAAEGMAAEMNNRAVSEVHPAYFLGAPAKRQTVAQPIWVFRMDNGRKAIIHGHTGSFLGWQ